MVSGGKILFFIGKFFQGNFLIFKGIPSENKIISSLEINFNSKNKIKFLSSPSDKLVSHSEKSTKGKRLPEENPLQRVRKSRSKTFKVI